jgi:hypothetical protein
MPDPATTAWVNAVIANGGTVSAGRQTLVDNLIVGLKADGVWAKLERLWLFAAENTQSALTDLVGDTLATAQTTVSGSPSFTVDTGYAGLDSVGTGPYIDTGYSGSGSSLYTQNDAHYSVWMMTNLATVNGGCCIGSKTGSDSNLFMTFFGDGNAYCRINDSPESGGQGVPGTRIGHWVANRTGAAASALYQSGSLFSNPNGTSAAVPSGNFTVLSNTQAFGTPNTISVASMGASLTTGQITSFYTRLNTYLAFGPTGASATMSFAAQTLSIPLKTTGNLKLIIPAQ